MGDKPLSSEELLRRAREGLSFSDDDDELEPRQPEKPTPTDGPESSSSSSEDLLDAFAAKYPETEVAASDEAAPSTTAFEAPLPPANTDVETIDSPPAPVPEWRPPATADGPVDPFGTQTDTTRSPIPSPGSLPPRPTAPQRSRASRGRVIWIVVFAIFVLGRCGSAVNFDVNTLFGGDTHVSELTTGDCLPPLEDDGVIDAVDTVDCASPHGLEVYAVISLGAASAAYPGDEQVAVLAFDACANDFERFVGTEYALSELWIYTLTPIEDGWETFNDREVVCMLYASPDDGFSISEETGSLRDSRR